MENVYQQPSTGVISKDREIQLRNFVDERRKANPEEFPEGCYSPKEFNCLVVDTFKKGFPLMKKQYLERVEKGDISPMKAGPGDGLIFNRGMISDVLEKPSMPRKHPRLP